MVCAGWGNIGFADSTITCQNEGMKTSTCGSSRRVLVGLWLMMPGCGAFSGGQSGTDSLEAIGVVRPETKCESAVGDGDIGDVLERANGCEKCVCESDGEWNCHSIDCAGDDESAAGSEGSDANEAATSEQPVAVTSAPPVNVPVVDECLSEIAEPSLGGSNGVYVAKDELAVVCLNPVSETKLCMKGSTVASGEDYTYWGGGMAFAMSLPTDDGYAPFDAASLGIEGVRFTVEGVRPPFMLRAYLNQVDSPAIADPHKNFGENSFVISELNENGVFEALFINAWPPAWTNLDVDQDGNPDTTVPFDPTQLNSLQFFVVANTYSGFDFDVCISDVEWITAEGDVVISN